VSLSFPLSFPGNSAGHPSIPCYMTTEWRQIKLSSSSRSIFTGSAQKQVFPGEYWEVRVKVPLMSRVRAGAWTAWLTSLRGLEGTFLLGDSSSLVAGPLGNHVGSTPVVDGAGQTGRVLNVKGLAVSASVFKAGDWISFGVVKEHLYMVVKDANSDGSGKAAIDIFPAILETTTDNDPIAWPGQGIFRLMSKGLWSVDQAMNVGIEFDAEQDV
jgi:hypothetical protein